jgi:hypothetical protein
VLPMPEARTLFEDRSGGLIPPLASPLKIASSRFAGMRRDGEKLTRDGERNRGVGPARDIIDGAVPCLSQQGCSASVLLFPEIVLDQVIGHLLRALVVIAAPLHQAYQPQAQPICTVRAAFRVPPPIECFVERIPFGRGLGALKSVPWPAHVKFPASDLNPRMNYEPSDAIGGNAIWGIAKVLSIEPWPLRVP